MQIWLIMNFLFSFASYGLSSYEWYLFAGFSVVMQRLAERNSVGENGENGENARPQSSYLKTSHSHKVGRKRIGT